MNTCSTPATTRTKAVQVVATIASETGEKRYRIWSRVYDRLQRLHNIDLTAYLRSGGESLLSVAERYGFIEQVYEATLTEWLFAQTTTAQ